MARSNSNLKQDLKQLENVAGRAGSDTIRLWEGYRDQAYMWRAVALLQMPATALAIISALIMYLFADTVVEVPDVPQPGFYSAKRLPDSQFIEAGVEFVNLISSYQHKTAREQFEKAAKMLWEPALTEFQNSVMKTQLDGLETSQKNQLFFVEDSLIKVERFPEEERVEVRIPGTRQKIVAGQPLPPEEWVYYLTMTTVPRNSLNPYGIVITNVRNQAITLDAIKAGDARLERQARTKFRRSQAQVRDSDVKVPRADQ